MSKTVKQKMRKMIFVAASKEKLNKVMAKTSTCKCRLYKLFSFQQEYKIKFSLQYGNRTTLGMSLGARNTVQMILVRRMSQNLSVNLSNLRMKYREKKEAFLEENIKVKEPISLFREWLDVALQTEEILEPNGACLATVNKDGLPSNRFVLLKDVTDEGFTFFTNYGSRKASDIASNPNVAMTLYWCPLRRSVRIEGIAEKIPSADSLAYFHQRPRASQIGALASEQSTLIPSRQYLDEIESNIKTKLGPDGEVPMPNWGGYLIRPRLIEFWQGQTDRLHDRIRFRRGEGIEKEVDGKLVHLGEKGWIYERLAP